MARLDYPAIVQELIQQLRRLPGVGPRSAERMTIWLLKHGQDCSRQLQGALAEAVERVGFCPTCGFYAQDAECGLCSDTRRDASSLCVVEQSSDILSIERTGAFQGHYHALGGRLSPLEQVGPEDLRIEELLVRARQPEVTEVVLALAADVEGESTSAYLAGRLASLPVRITRLAHGLPAGGGLEYADELTLQHAFRGRTVMGNGEVP